MAASWSGAGGAALLTRCPDSGLPKKPTIGDYNLIRIN